MKKKKSKKTRIEMFLEELDAIEEKYRLIIVGDGTSKVLIEDLETGELYEC